MPPQTPRAFIRSPESGNSSGIMLSAAVSPAMLVSSRFLQGTGEALASPAALSMIPLLFPDSGERMKALGVWGGIAGLGGTLGSVISGALTGLASWRWIFYINIPVVLFALLLVPRVLSESRMARAREPQVVLDPGEGDGHHGDVEDQHELDRGQHAQRPPSPRVAAGLTRRASGILACGAHEIVPPCHFRRVRRVI
jgi:MFS family permease